MQGARARAQLALMSWRRLLDRLLGPSGDQGRTVMPGPQVELKSQHSYRTSDATPPPPDCRALHKMALRKL